MNQSMNQSNQSINQSNQSIKEQSINQSINQSIDQSINLQIVIQLKVLITCFSAAMVHCAIYFEQYNSNIPTCALECVSGTS
jgi:hypothetical protein